MAHNRFHENVVIRNSAVEPEDLDIRDSNVDIPKKQEKPPVICEECKACGVESIVHYKDSKYTKHNDLLSFYDPEGNYHDHYNRYSYQAEIGRGDLVYTEIYGCSMGHFWTKERYLTNCKLCKDKPEQALKYNRMEQDYQAHLCEQRRLEYDQKKDQERREEAEKTKELTLYEAKRFEERQFYLRSQTIPARLLHWILTGERIRHDDGRQSIWGTWRR